MPFIHLHIAGPAPRPEQTAALQQGVTELMARVLRKQPRLTAVLVEQVPPGAWAIGGQAVARGAHLEATVSAGTNSAQEKEDFIAAAQRLLAEVLGADFSPICYVVVREVSKDSWGYNGLTQARRAADAL